MIKNLRLTILLVAALLAASCTFIPEMLQNGIPETQAQTQIPVDEQSDESWLCGKEGPMSKPCDDGNTDEGDGCSRPIGGTACVVETGWIKDDPDGKGPKKPTFFRDCNKNAGQDGSDINCSYSKGTNFCSKQAITVDGKETQVCKTTPGYVCDPSRDVCFKDVSCKLSSGFCIQSEGCLPDGQECQTDVPNGWECDISKNECHRLTCEDVSIRGQKISSPGCLDERLDPSDPTSFKVDRDNGWVCGNTSCERKDACWIVAPPKKVVKTDCITQVQNACKLGNEGVCQIQDGYKCDNSECWDNSCGIKGKLTENCEDKNTAAGDGCSRPQDDRVCVVEKGWIKDPNGNGQGNPTFFRDCNKNAGKINASVDCSYSKGGAHCNAATITVNGNSKDVCKTDDGYRCDPVKDVCFQEASCKLPSGSCIKSEGCLPDGQKCLTDIPNGWVCDINKNECHRLTCEDVLNSGQKISSPGCLDELLDPSDPTSFKVDRDNGWVCGNTKCWNNTCGTAGATSNPCDDGNVYSNDGCARPTNGKACVVEDGFEKKKTGTGYVEIHHDNKVVGNEQCDEGNIQPSGGCSSNGTITPGWSCPSEPGTSMKAGKGGECFQGCQKVKNPQSAKDCLQHTPKGACHFDTKSKKCVLGEGWQCANPDFAKKVCKDSPKKPSVVPINGDGIVIFGYEGCDDGNKVSGDGCSANGTVEGGWLCRNTSSGKAGSYTYPSEVFMPVSLRDDVDGAFAKVSNDARYKDCFSAGNGAFDHQKVILSFNNNANTCTRPYELFNDFMGKNVKKDANGEERIFTRLIKFEKDSSGANYTILQRNLNKIPIPYYKGTYPNAHMAHIISSNGQQCFRDYSYGAIYSGRYRALAGEPLTKFYQDDNAWAFLDNHAIIDNYVGVIASSLLTRRDFIPYVFEIGLKKDKVYDFNAFIINTRANQGGMGVTFPKDTFVAKTYCSKCGDGILDAPVEECDLGADNQHPKSGCTSDCRIDRTQKNYETYCYSTYTGKSVCTSGFPTCVGVN